MNVLLDIAPGPTPSLGLGELLILSACCGLGLLLVGGGVAVAFLLKRKTQ